MLAGVEVGLVTMMVVVVVALVTGDDGSRTANGYWWRSTVVDMRDT